MLLPTGRSREEQDVLTLRAFVQDVFDVTLAIYALIRLDRGDRRDALRLRTELHSWLEVRGVEARANVVGTIHERYEAGAVTELDGPRARDFTTAANAAWRFVRKPTLRLAFKDLGFSDATLVLAEDVLRRLAQHEGVSW